MPQMRATYTGSILLFAKQENHHRRMKYEVRLSGIERKLPKQFKLPTTFRALVEACGNFERGELGWFAIKYTGTKHFIGFDAKDCLGDKSLYTT